MKRTARLSPCGAYRWTLGRQWDDRPILLVCMFNPIDADADIDDPTISLVCHIASHNGFGGVVVVNAVPLRGSKPAGAIEMVNTWDTRQDWYARDCLHYNLGVIVSEVEKAGAVLLAWGALGPRMRATQAEHQRRAMDVGSVAVYSILRDWLKGQITAIETGMLSFEGAFLGNLLLPNGQTILDHVEQQKLLPAPESKP